MELKSVQDFLDSKFPIKNACDWDNVGLQNKVKKINVTKVLISMDTTKEVVDFAIANKANLIINHHPLAFAGYKMEINNSYKKQLFERLEAGNIAVYACHTSFDKSNDSMSRKLLRDLGALQIRSFGTEGVGAQGEIEDQIVMKKFIAKLKNYYGIDSAMYYGDISAKIQRIAVCSGAGGDLLDDFDKKQNDVFITGELKWDQWIKAQQLDIPVVVLNHYMENQFVEIMVKICSEKFKNTSVEVISYNIKNPINYL